MLKQGLNHAKSRNREHRRDRYLNRGKNYINSYIREAVVQAHPEFPLRLKTYSWTAAFVLKAGAEAQARTKSYLVAHHEPVEEGGA